MFSVDSILYRNHVKRCQASTEHVETAASVICEANSVEAPSWRLWRVISTAQRGKLPPMSGKRQFEQQIAALDTLREAPEEARVDPIRKALTHKNNFITAKGADLAREFNLRNLTPDLLQAFDRFFENPEKTDPQCWAKNAISRALAAFELQESDVFLRGMRHVQLEAVWGGRSDTAGTLRATCAFALVQCRTLTNDDLLRHLADLFADSDKAVRAEVVRAIE